jgi:hypothetical protein
MGNINTIIPERNFELIRDRVAQILTVELSEQLALTGNDLFSAIVWKERFIAFDKSDMPAINVYFVNSSHDNFTVQSGNATNSINIDFYVSGKHVDGIDGDKNASLDLQKLIGVCSYILQHPFYYKLDFDGGFIRNRQISDIIIAQPKEKDARHIANGRIVFKVIAGENYGSLEAIEASGYDTKVQLEETDKGFYYTTNN